MFPVRNPTQIQDNGTATKGKASAEGTPARLRDVKESECMLTSVQTLRQNVAKMRHRRESLVARFINPHVSLSRFPELSEILEKHTFVGIVDTHKCLSLVQYSTNLYLVNHSSLGCVILLEHVSINILTPSV